MLRPIVVFNQARTLFVTAVHRRLQRDCPPRQRPPLQAIHGQPQALGGTEAVKVKNYVTVHTVYI